MSSEVTTCPECHGEGKVMNWGTGKKENCLECDGLGRVRAEWYDTYGAKDQPEDANRPRPIGGK